MNNRQRPLPPGTQEVQLPAVQVPVTGLKADYHHRCHTQKLAKYPLDAGMDLYSSEIEKVVPYGHIAIIWVHTFLVIHLGPGSRGRIEGRSSSIEKLAGGLVVPGLIDAGYTGEIMIRVQVPNEQKVIDAVSSAIMVCRAQELAIAQFVFEQNVMILPVEAVVQPLDTLPGGGRGPKGFGSSDNITKLF